MYMHICMYICTHQHFQSLGMHQHAGAVCQQFFLRPPRIHVYIHIYIYIYMCIYIYMYLHRYIYMYTCIYIYICMNICIYIYISIHFFNQHAYAYVHIRMHTPSHFQFVGINQPAVVFSIILLKRA